MKKILSRLVICSTNDHDSHKNDKVKGWIEHNGGKYTPKITSDTTHLLASTQAWKRYTPLVKEARRTKRIKIVKLDWLEDSLSLGKSAKLRNTAEYEWELISAEKKRASVEREKSRSKSKAMSTLVGKSIPTSKSTSPATYPSVETPQASPPEAQFGGLVNSAPASQSSSPLPLASTRPAIGQTAPMSTSSVEAASEQICTPLTTCDKQLRMNVESEMTRSERIASAGRSPIVCHAPSKLTNPGIKFDRECLDFEKEMRLEGYHPYRDPTGFTYMIHLVRYDVLKNRVENHRLKLYESDSLPHTYSCMTQYTRTGVKRQIETLAPAGSNWTFAFDMFRKFFKKRCNVQWALDEYGQKLVTQQTDNVSNGYFHWQKPGESNRLSMKPNPAQTFENAAVTIDSDSEMTDVKSRDLNSRATTPIQGW